MGVMAEGMAFGAGSSVAHMAVGSMMGGSGSSAAAPADAPQAAPGAPTPPVTPPVDASYGAPGAGQSEFAEPPNEEDNYEWGDSGDWGGDD